MYPNRSESLQRACQELVQAKETLRLAEANLRHYLTGSLATEATTDEPMDLSSFSDFSDKSFSDTSKQDLSVEIVEVVAAETVDVASKTVDVAAAEDVDVAAETIDVAAKTVAVDVGGVDNAKDDK